MSTLNYWDEELQQWVTLTGAKDVPIDTTLSKTGEAADAKVTGDKFSTVNTELSKKALKTELPKKATENTLGLIKPDTGTNFLLEDGTLKTRTNYNPKLQTIVNWNQIDPSETLSQTDFQMGALKVEPWTIFSGNSYEFLENGIKGQIPSNTWFELKSSLAHFYRKPNATSDAVGISGFFKGCSSTSYNYNTNPQNVYLDFHITRVPGFIQDEKIIISIIGLDSSGQKMIPLQKIIDSNYFIYDNSDLSNYQGTDGFSGWFRFNLLDFSPWTIPDIPPEIIGNANSFDTSKIIYINISGNTADRTSVVPETFEQLDIPVQLSVGNILIEQGNQEFDLPLIGKGTLLNTDGKIKEITTSDVRIPGNTTRVYQYIPIKEISAKSGEEVTTEICNNIHLHKNRKYLFLLDVYFHGMPGVYTVKITPQVNGSKYKKVLANGLRAVVADGEMEQQMYFLLECKDSSIFDNISIKSTLSKNQGLLHINGVIIECL